MPVATITARRASSVVVADRHPPLAVELSLAAEQLDPALLEPGQLAGVVEVVDHLVAAVEHRLGVEIPGHRLRTPGHAAHLLQQLAGAQQRLRGHAGVEGAFAADQLLLDQGHLEAAVGEPPRADLAGRAGAEHDHVEFGLRHPRITTRTVQSNQT